MEAPSFDVNFKLVAPPPGLRDWLKNTARAFYATSFQLTESLGFWECRVEFDTIEKAGIFAKAITNVTGTTIEPSVRPGREG
jgi:hypothetical protein